MGKTPPGIYRVSGVGNGMRLKGILLKNGDEIRVNDIGEATLNRLTYNIPHRVQELDNINLIDTFIYSTKRLKKVY